MRRRSQLLLSSPAWSAGTFKVQSGDARHSRRFRLCIVVACMLGTTTVLAEDAKRKDAASEPKPRHEQAIFRFEGGEITVGDVEDALAREPSFVRRAYRDPDKLREYARRMLRTRLLAREAKHRGLDAHPNVQHTVKNHAIQKLIKERIDDVITPGSISTEDVEAYFDAHRHDFNHPATRRASHILVEDAARAQELLKKARKADLREFRQLAREHSLDEETKLRGGDLQYFDRTGRMPAPTANGTGYASRDASEAPPVAEPIVQAAFSLEEAGDVVKAPVEVEGGYSIVMLTGTRPAVERTWKDVAERIRARLARDRRQQAVDELVARLKKKHPPTVHPEPLLDIDVTKAPFGSQTKPGFPRSKAARD